MTWNNALDALHGAVLSTFAEQITVGGSPVNATFERRYIELPAGDTVQAGYAPIIEGKAADLAAIDYESEIVVRGQAFTVIDLQPDGRGWLVAVLREA